MNLALTNARLIDPATGTQTHGGVLVRDGVIVDLGPSVRPGALPEGAEIHDCGGLILAPGLIDLCAFAGEPGAEHRETLRTASEAAAAGGVTTLVCRPDTDPVVDDPAIIDFIKRRARDKAIVNVLPSAALTKGLRGGEMTEFGLLMEAGAVFFTDGPRSVMNAQVMRRALIYARDFGALIVHHPEDPNLRGEGVMNEGEFASRLGLHGIPHVAETIILERDLALVAATGGRYHASMISCSGSIELIRRAKAAGLNVTCGVSINNLTLNENDVGAYRTFCKLSPPLRHENERLALVDALADGTIDVIVSDHDPQDVETKRQPFGEAANGAVGLETMLSAALRLHHSGDVPLPRLIAAMTSAPAALIGSQAGRLAVGAPADLIVIDPDAAYVLAKAKLRSRSKNSPFDEARMDGRVVSVMVGGRRLN
ncbi:MAG: dihydroorotase [Bosea sp.]|jgi:dihydroorotase|nr:dihydroorotase [Bosea sp. (in: a-proteobacteria)]